MQLVQGQYYKVKITTMKMSGAVVTFEDGETGFVHLSQISKKYVHSCDEYLQIGQELAALGVPGRARPVELSFKHLDLQPIVSTPKPAEKQESSKPAKREYKQQRRESRPRKGPPPVYRPVDHKGESLDDMIARSQKDLADKQRSWQERETSRRRRIR